MTTLNLQLTDIAYNRLIKAANKDGKTIQAMIYHLIDQLPEIDESYDITQDPVFQMEGYDSDAPPDLSQNLDDYLYGETK